MAVANPLTPPVPPITIVPPETVIIIPPIIPPVSVTSADPLTNPEVILLNEDEVKADPKKYLNHYVTYIDKSNYAFWSAWWYAWSWVTPIALSLIVIAGFVTAGFVYPVAIPFMLFLSLILLYGATEASHKLGQKSKKYHNLAQIFNDLRTELETIRALSKEDLCKLLRTEGIEPDQIEHYNIIKEAEVIKKLNETEGFLEEIELDQALTDPLELLQVPLAKVRTWEKIAEKSQTIADNCLSKANEDENKTRKKRRYRYELVDQRYKEEQEHIFSAKVQAAYLLTLVANPFYTKKIEEIGSRFDEIYGNFPSLEERACLAELGDADAETYFKFNAGSGKADLTREDFRDSTIQELATRMFGFTPTATGAGA